MQSEIGIIEDGCFIGACSEVVEGMILARILHQLARKIG